MAPAATPSTPGPSVHLRNAHPPRHPHQQEGQIEVLADQWEGKKLNAPDRPGGEQKRPRLLHRSGLRRAGRPPRAGFLRRLPPSAQRPPEAGGQTRRPPRRHRAFAQRPRPLRHQFRRAQHARLRLDHNGDASGERVLVAGYRRRAGRHPRDEKGDLYVAMPQGSPSTAAEGKPIHTIDMHDALQLSRSIRRTIWLYVTARGHLYRIARERKTKGGVIGWKARAT